MVAFAKVDAARQDIANGLHKFGSDVFAICLSNRAPVVATDRLLTDIVEIAQAGGYFTGGWILNRSSSSNAGGLYKSIFDDPGPFTASADIGPFRYIWLANQSTGGSPLTPGAVLVLGYWDYGAAITIKTGEIFRPDLDNVNGVLQQV